MPALRPLPITLATGLLSASAAAEDVQIIQIPVPVTDAAYAPLDPEEARLGQLLYWDPILSGNRNISCGTCHHPRYGTSDGLSLGLGEGGVGLGPDRVPDPDNMPEQRIPRNAPGLWNLGALEFTTLFHDGRIAVDETRPSGLRTPLDYDMVGGFANLLSAQNIFPLLAADEMAGHYAENEISSAIRQGLVTGPGGAWGQIAGRVAAIPDYAEMFAEVYPEIAEGRPIAFTDISNAIAAFVAYEFRSDDSPFDRHLWGEPSLDEYAMAGKLLFYGEAGCAICHSGPFLTDHDFHAMGQPQLGPGKGERAETHQRDLGRMRVTGKEEHAYAFRTPSLRNVAQTGPWGHAGAFSELRAFLVHHLDPLAGLDRYVPQATLPAFEPARPDWTIMETPAERVAIAAAAAAAAAERPEISLTDPEIDALLAFLESLSDETALDGRLGIPDAVPSGLPVDR